MPAKKKKKQQQLKLQSLANRATTLIGSTASLVTHTVIFVASFLLPIVGLIKINSMLLVLTTLLSFEAIYLAIFIQMSVNKNTADIEEIQEDVEDIQEDIEEIGEDVDEIQKDVDEIQEDVDEIQEDIEEDQKKELTEELKEQKEYEALASIQAILTNLQKEIEQLKK